MQLLRALFIGLSCLCFVAHVHPALKMHTEPVGLTNVGNSCFMNAILQVLYVTPVAQAFVELENQCAPDGLLKAYRDFLINYNATEPGQVCSSWDFYTQLEEHRIVVTAVQDDPDVMLRRLFDRWDEQLKSVNASLKEHCVSPLRRSIQLIKRKVLHQYAALGSTEKVESEELLVLSPQGGSFEKGLAASFGTVRK